MATRFQSSDDTQNSTHSFLESFSLFWRSKTLEKLATVFSPMINYIFHIHRIKCFYIETFCSRSINSSYIETTLFIKSCVSRKTSFIDANELISDRYVLEAATTSTWMRASDTVYYCLSKNVYAKEYNFQGQYI